MEDSNSVINKMKQTPNLINLVMGRDLGLGNKISHHLPQRWSLVNFKFFPHDSGRHAVIFVHIPREITIFFSVLSFVYPEASGNIIDLEKYFIIIIYKKMCPTAMHQSL